MMKIRLYIQKSRNFGLMLAKILKIIQTMQTDILIRNIEYSLGGIKNLILFFSQLDNNVIFKGIILKCQESTFFFNKKFTCTVHSLDL